VVRGPILVVIDVHLRGADWLIRLTGESTTLLKAVARVELLALGGVVLHLGP
jgi:hypothetical protein